MVTQYYFFVQLISVILLIFIFIIIVVIIINFVNLYPHLLALVGLEFCFLLTDDSLLCCHLMNLFRMPLMMTTTTMVRLM